MCLVCVCSCVCLCVLYVQNALRVCRHHAHMCFNVCAWCRHTRGRFESVKADFGQSNFGQSILGQFVVLFCGVVFVCVVVVLLLCCWSAVDFGQCRLQPSFFFRVRPISTSANFWMLNFWTSHVSRPHLAPLQVASKCAVCVHFSFHRDCALTAGIQPAVRGLYGERVGASPTTHPTTEDSSEAQPHILWRGRVGTKEKNFKS